MNAGEIYTILSTSRVHEAFRTLPENPPRNILASHVPQ